ncbi:MAG: hypothetical protein WD004_05015 [Actinomycetota bacterium]
MPRETVRARMWEEDGRWQATIDGPSRKTYSAATRDACFASLRRAAGRDATLTVEVLPRLAGVAEAAKIMGWDKRRVVTYLDRGTFPAPIATLASGRVWRAADIEAYARLWHGRRKGRR